MHWARSGLAVSKTAAALHAELGGLALPVEPVAYLAAAFSLGDLPGGCANMLNLAGRGALEAGEKKKGGRRRGGGERKKIAPSQPCALTICN